MQNFPKILTADFRPIVIEKGVIIQPWRKGHNKNLKTGVTAAPISIGGIRYICCVVNTRNAQKKISPYSIRLFDNTQIRDMLQSNIVHHSTTSTSQPSDTSNANPLTVAKVLQKYLLANNSREKDVDDNEDNNSTDTTNENKLKRSSCGRRPYEDHVVRALCVNLWGLALV